MTIEQWSLSRRLEHIRQLSESTQQGNTYPLIFQGDQTYFPVYTVDLGFPCYRLANGRTLAAQKEIISNEGLQEDFFADPDSTAALEKQAEILLAMVQVGTDREIYNLLKQNPQTEPLVMTHEGYLLNGNRRLRAMRLLYEEDETTYERFQHVQVVLLPVCSHSDLDELEAQLQWAPEGRSDYSWVTQAILLRQRRENGWSLDKLSTLFKRTKKEVQTMIAMVDDADEYLEKRNFQGQYSKVIDKEYALEQLQIGRKKCRTEEPKKQFFTDLTYHMLDDPADAGERLYQIIPDALKHIDIVLEQTLSDMPDEGDGDEINDDDLGVLGLETETPFELASRRIQDIECGDQIRLIIRDSIEEGREDERAFQDAMYCRNQIQRASTALQSALAHYHSDVTTAGMAELLNSIEETTQRIKELLSNGHN